MRLAVLHKPFHRDRALLLQWRPCFKKCLFCLFHWTRQRLNDATSLCDFRYHVKHNSVSVYGDILHTCQEAQWQIFTVLVLWQFILSSVLRERGSWTSLSSKFADIFVCFFFFWASCFKCTGSTGSHNKYANKILLRISFLDKCQFSFYYHHCRLRGPFLKNLSGNTD